MNPSEFLAGEVSPTIWLMIATSLVIGFFFATGIIVNDVESVLYSTDILVDKTIWGSILFSSSLIGLIGCYSKNIKAIKLCGVVNFAVWLFACIGMALAAHWYLLIAVYGVHLIFHLLLFFGTVTNDVFREPIYRR